MNDEHDSSCYPSTQGPAKKALDFFAASGYPCPPRENPADHFLDVITPNINDSVDSLVEKEAALKALYKPPPGRSISQHDTAYVAPYAPRAVVFGPHYMTCSQQAMSTRGCANVTSYPGSPHCTAQNTRCNRCLLPPPSTRLQWST